MEASDSIEAPNDHITNDPSPPGQDASDETRSAYRTLLKEYCGTWVERYENLDRLTAEEIWCDFTSDFSLIGIHNMDNDSMTSIRRSLIKNGVNVRCRRGLSRSTALKECWNEESCPHLQDGKENKTVDSDSTEQIKVIHEEKEVENEVREGHKNEIVNQIEFRTHDREPNRSSGNSRDLEGLVKAYSGRRKYTGAYEEDLIGTIEVYELTSKLYGLTEEQMMKGIIVMLDGAALTYFASNLQNCTKYREVIDGLISWFTSDEQRSRLLQDWQSTRLSKWLKKYPEKPQTAVFQELSAHLTKVQRQLHPDYRKDRFLKDAIVASADLPDISKALKEKVPVTAHEATQRIAALLPDTPHQENHDEAFYGIGRRYMGKASQRQKRPRRSRDRFKLSAVEGCWVCGKNHNARQNHSKEEVDKAVNRLKGTGAYVSIEEAIEVFLPKIIQTITRVNLNHRRMVQAQTV